MAKTYFLSLRNRERAVFEALFNRLAVQDVVGEERICIEREPLWRLAAARHRLVFFCAEGNLMLCSGYQGYGAGRLRRKAALELAQQCHDDYLCNGS